ncbi:MAG TPA: hypothetical protein VK435_06000 [Thermodesulfovibrionales bacterium]|nr:hypothetical protein [Thermodesulfovibrionales bacterium]
MNIHPIHCPNCRIALPYQMYNTDGPAHCPSCEGQTKVEVFPALYNGDSVPYGAETLQANEPGCFFHPQKKAVVPCALCGRFLCALCDVEFGGRHVCPLCLAAGKKKKKIRDLETQRVLYDDIALALAIIPIILIWGTIITAPMSLYVAIRHWKSPSSIIPRTKLRFVLAILLSGAQTTGWLFLFGWLISRA